jgi:hypothetical protein
MSLLGSMVAACLAAMLLALISAAQNLPHEPVQAEPVHRAVHRLEQIDDATLVLRCRLDS